MSSHSHRGYASTSGQVVTGLKADPDPENEGYSRVLWLRNGEEINL